MLQRSFDVALRLPFRLLRGAEVPPNFVRIISAFVASASAESLAADAAELPQHLSYDRSLEYLVMTSTSTLVSWPLAESRGLPLENVDKDANTDFGTKCRSLLRTASKV